MNFILSILFSFSSLSHSVTRFEQNQLSFQLVENTGETIECSHKPLESVTPVPPPPWWVVECGDREYTTDIWMELRELSEDLSSILLLYHAKESISSSGEDRTRFETQTTRLFYSGEPQFKIIRSSIDVRNGLADLYVTVTP